MFASEQCIFDLFLSREFWTSHINFRLCKSFLSIYSVFSSLNKRICWEISNHCWYSEGLSCSVHKQRSICRPRHEVGCKNMVAESSAFFSQTERSPKIFLMQFCTRCTETQKLWGGAHGDIYSTYVQPILITKQNHQGKISTQFVEMLKVSLFTDSSVML